MLLVRESDTQVTGFDLGRSGRLFTDVRAAGRAPLVGFLHVGYPDVATSLMSARSPCWAHSWMPGPLS